MLLIPVVVASLGVTAGLPTSADSTRITVLYDAFGERQDLRQDWGFAALVEHNGRRILFDTGNDSEFFRHNVETLHLDLTELDAVVISHRHGDHTDGLRYLLEINPDVQILVPDDEYFGGPTPAAFFRNPVDSLPTRMRYFGGRVPEVIPHGSPWKHARTMRIRAQTEIAPGIRVVSNVSRGETFRETPELSLVIDTPEGQILLVGCSHPGIEQILESVSARTRAVRLLVGGLHWVPLSQPEVERLSRSLRDEWKVTAVAPGHCTGEPGFAALSKHFGEQYVYAGVGTTIRL
jgi:7,8-dihydropterin-6-yl-methyl-4-(beta-D-ribofuranosyl)aminobenzene 5'-phosphate synthase